MQEVKDAIDVLLQCLTKTTAPPGSLEWHLQNNLEAYRRELQNNAAEQNDPDEDEPTVWMV